MYGSRSGKYTMPMSWHAVEISPVLCATAAWTGRRAGSIELNRCSSRMRIACSLLSLLRKSPRTADNNLTNPSAVTSLFIPLSCAAWSSTPRRNSTPSTCASRRTCRAYSTPTKSSSKFVARLLLVAIIPSASVEIFAARPINWYSSGIASESGLRRKGEPSAALMKRFRTCSESSK